MNEIEELAALEAEFAGRGQATPQQSNELEELQQLEAEYNFQQNPNASRISMAGQGATLGFADEMAGALTAPFTDTQIQTREGYENRDIPERLRSATMSDTGEPAAPIRDMDLPEQYAHNRDIVRQNLEDYREARPIESTVMEVAGSLPAGAVSATKNIPAMIGRATAEGGAYGAGTSEEQGIEGQAQDALIGAGLGLTVGGALGGASKMIDKFKPPSAADQAKNILYDTLEQVPEGFEGATRAAQQLPNEGALVNSLSDVGESLGQGSVGLSPFKAKQTAQNMATQQADTSTGRIKGYMNNLLKRDSTPDYYGNLSGQMQQRVEQATPYYEASKNNVIELTDEFKSVLENPRMQKLIKKSRQYIEDTTGQKLDGVDMMRYGNMNEVVKAANQVLKNDPVYSDVITKSMTPKGKQAKALKDRLLQHMDFQDISGNYKTARSIWSDQSSVIDAMETGLKEFRGITPNALQHKINRMNGPELEAYADGAIESITQKMGNAKSGQMSNYNFLNSDNAKEKLQLLLPDKDVDKLFNQLDVERSMRSTANAMLGNSMTALRQQATDALKRGTIDNKTIRFMKQNVLANITDIIKEKDAAYAAQVSDELADLLFSTKGPENVSDMLRQLKVDRGTRKKVNAMVPDVLNAMRLPLIEQSINE